MKEKTLRKLRTGWVALGAVIVAWGLSAGEETSPAYLVIAPYAVEGQPIADGRMRHFALPDPKLRAKLKALGFEVGVAPIASEMTIDFLKRFNVIVVLQRALPDYFPGLEDMMLEKEKLILDYVREGGGLLVMRTTAYQFGRGIEGLNEWLKPLGVEILQEQVVDDSNKIKLETDYALSWTGNIMRHPATGGVDGLFYPAYHTIYADTTSPLKLGKEWRVLVRGERTAKSLRTVKAPKPPPPSAGTYSSQPPLLAVRSYGRGRVAVFPINCSCLWQDAYHPLWGRGVIMNGEAKGMRSNAETLLCNLMKYLAEPSRSLFGGYNPPPPPPKKPEVGFRRINWEKARLAGPYHRYCFKGLIGAVSSLSSGEGEPLDFIRSAKEAGYDFIAFAEELDKLTEDEFNELARICEGNSSENFRAYPGFSYLDESGNSWLTFSDRLTYPGRGWWSEKYPARLKNNNVVSRGSHWTPVIMLKAHSNPEKPWFQGNFKVIALYTYEDGKLVDDSVDIYRKLQRMRFALTPVVVHIVRSPSEVKEASRAGYQTYLRWPDSDMVSALSGHIGRYRGNYVFIRSSFVSEGPIVEDFRILNFGTSDLAIPGNDRWRLHIRISSDVGLRELIIYDGDRREPWRRFLLKGEKVFDRQIDHFHERQHELIARATDIQGNSAWSWTTVTSVQENSFPRCSDNFNTMPRGKWWGTPKNMMNTRGIENYLCARGFAYVGLARLYGAEESLRPAVEYYPRLACRFGTILDCVMKEHYPPTASGNPDKTDIPERAVRNEYIEGVARHTLFTPWQDGTIVELVESNFTVKKPFKMTRAEVCTFVSRKHAEVLCVSEPDGFLYAGKLVGRNGSYVREIKPGGFAALLPQPFRGSVGFIPLDRPLVVHAFHGGRDYYNLRGLLWWGPREVKAGELLSYRYLALTSPLDPSPDTKFIMDVVESLGIRGKTAYTIKSRIGSVVDTRFTLKLRAEDYSFVGQISQAKLPLQLPTLIEGLNPRWHAGIWYPGRQTLERAEWVVDEMNQRYTVRRRWTARDAILHFPVIEDGIGFLQIDTSSPGRFFVGNLLVCDRPEVVLTLLRWGSKPAVLAHNPTDERITCTIRPSKGFALLGHFSKRVELPPGSSLELPLRGG